MEAAGVKALLKQVLTVAGSAATYLSQSAVHLTPAIPLQPTQSVLAVTVVPTRPASDNKRYRCFVLVEPRTGSSSRPIC